MDVCEFKKNYFWKSTFVILLLFNIIFGTLFITALVDKKIINKKDLLYSKYFDFDVNYKDYNVSDFNTVLGSEDAKLVIYYYTDFECPFSKKFNKVFDDIKRDFVDTNQVKIVFINLPKVEIHKSALIEAEAFECASEQGKTLEAYEFLFKKKKLDENLIIASCEDLNLNQTQFRNCLSEQKYREKVLFDLNYAKELGITQTPTFVIGDTIIEGVKPYLVFKKVISEELNKLN